MQPIFSKYWMYKFAKLTSLSLFVNHQFLTQCGSYAWQYYIKKNKAHELLKFLCERLRRNKLPIFTKELILSSTGVVAYNWDTNRIPECELKDHFNELDYVHFLKKQTLCNFCNKFETYEPLPQACQCDRLKRVKKSDVDSWNLFIVRHDLVIWRKLHHSGQYIYKVYGRYPDVCAEDFFNVQLDVKYRTKWDSTVISLKVIDSDPENHSQSDVLYWEVLWPKLFVNRDYVFNRRYVIDQESNTLLLVNKCTEHPLCPQLDSKHRVKDYWSYMVIKPFTNLNELGVEFSLTYFDNPGVNMSSTVSTWVATRAMPEFLDRLRQATKKYRGYCEEEGVAFICQFTGKKQSKDFDKKHTYEYFDPDFIIDNTIYEAQHGFHFKTNQDRTQLLKHHSMDNAEVLSNESELSQYSNSLSATESNQQISNYNIWKYTQLKHYLS